MDSISERFRALASAKGYTVNGLAQSVGIGASTAHSIASGRSNPSFELLVKVISHFPDLNPDWLLLGAGPMIRTQAANDPACWDLLKREEEQHQQLRTDYHELKHAIQLARSNYDRLVWQLKQEAPAELLQRLGIS